MTGYALGYEIDLEAFWSFVDKTDDCWNWIGEKKSGGYGIVRPIGPRKRLKAHRVSWELAKGDILGDLNVLHKCDNPSCVNPDHLFLGTQLDNVRDMWAKGRQGDYRNFGTSNGRTILTPEQVAEIKAHPGYLRGKAAMGSSLKDLAKKFGVAYITVQKIRSGTNWRGDGC